MITIPFNAACHDYYAEMSRKGDFLCWDDYLTSEEGVKLRSCFPESYWKGIMVDGKVYALLSPFSSLKEYYVINKALALKYGITEDRIKSENINELVSIVYQNEKAAGNEELIAFEAVGWNGIGKLEYPLVSAEGIGVQEENGKWKARFLIDIPEYQAFIREINKLYLEGGYKNAGRQREEGNFFVRLCTTFSEKSAGLMCLSLLNPGLQDKWGLDHFWIMEAGNQRKCRYRGAGCKVAVRSESKNSALAMRVLAEIYQDADLSELLSYGIEGKNWSETGDGKQIESLGDEIAFYAGNPFLIRTTTAEDEDRARILWNLIEQETSTLCGFHMDISKNIDVWEKIVSLYGMHSASYYSGMGEDLEKEEEEIRKQLRSIDGYSVLEEIERQLNQFMEGEA